MDAEHCIFKLDDDSQKRFAETDEVFPGIQLGVIHQSREPQYYIVVSGKIAVSVENGMENSLKRFYRETWAEYRQRQRSALQQPKSIEQLYVDWYNSLISSSDMHCEPAARSTIQHYAATGTMPASPAAAASPVAPPPPNRPGLMPGLVPPPGPSVHGHLPFQDVTTAFEIFYRFEAYPTSIRITKGLPGSYIAGTFASPSSELPFLPTGFAAVARNALPSFFPAVFRYELAPAIGSNVLCGAVVPMFGMSGGGVEVMFMDPVTRNRGAIADPAVVLPL